MDGDTDGLAVAEAPMLGDDEGDSDSDALSDGELVRLMDGDTDGLAVAEAPELGVREGDSDTLLDAEAPLVEDKLVEGDGVTLAITAGEEEADGDRP
jgi:hypothetical protein